MKLNKQILNTLILSTLTLAMTACGGSSAGDSSSCISKATDSDGDGFHDDIDIAPSDASIPGDFSTPEKILANPKVQKALKIAKENNVNIATALGNNPPNLTGYYRMESGGGDIVATETGLNNSEYFYGIETKVCTDKKYYEYVGSSFGYGNRFMGKTIVKNAMIRGDGKNFTHYIPQTIICKGERQSRIWIVSGKVNSDGNIVNRKVVFISVGTASIAQTCNKWEVGYYENNNRITNLDELEYMCVDGKKAYVPGETWKNKDKESCTCTKDVEIECK